GSEQAGANASDLCRRHRPIAQLGPDAAVRPREEPDRDGLAVADDVDRDRRVRTDRAHGGGQVGTVDDGAPVDADQLVAGAQPRGLRDAAGGGGGPPGAALYGGEVRADAS